MYPLQKKKNSKNKKTHPQTILGIIEFVANLKESINQIWSYTMINMTF